MKPTPSSGLARRTPDEASVAIVDARARIGAARALALLVERHATSTKDAHAAELRELLRQLIARTRHTSLVLRMHDGTLAIEGVPLDKTQLQSEGILGGLQDQLVRRGISLLSIRDGAAPGELLTLAGLLAKDGPVTGEQAAVGSAGSAPSSRQNSDAFTSQRELLRTWSVLVVAGHAPALGVTDSESHGGGSGTRTGTGTARTADNWSRLSNTADNWSRLSNARTDIAAVTAVTTLVDNVDGYAERNDAEAVENVARAIVHAIDAVGAGAGRLALEGGLRRILRPNIIALLASRLPLTSDRPALLALFARAGDVGVRALQDGLMSASDPLSRRVYFDAIVSLDMGGSLLLEALRDPRWFVVRNTAALIGEMNIADADRELITLLGSDDERIRIAAARALIRIRTPKALSALHGAIDDANVEVRRLSATSYTIVSAIAGAARPAAIPLAAALDREQDEDVALEMMAALGRLGSADAVQRLMRIAQSPSLDGSNSATPDARGRTPRPGWARIAALEALVDARGENIRDWIRENGLGA